MGNVTIWGPESEKLLIAGLTGGIASGKSEVSSEFKRLGACLIDADVLARVVVEPGRPAYQRIVEEFGRGVLDEKGELDRKALAEVVFSDRDKLQLLNSITHPAIFEEMGEGVRRYAASVAEGAIPVVIVDAALIVDVGITSMFDDVIVVTAPAEERVRRMVVDRGMDEAESRARIASQVPDEKRVQHAAVVIDNSGTLDDLRAEVSRAWETLKVEARKL